MQPTPELYLAVTRAYHPLPNPGRGLLLASDAPGHPNLHLQVEPGGELERLAASGERTLPVASTPLGILIRHDTGGDELSLQGRFLAQTDRDVDSRRA